jgi:hypothetical protein
MNPAGTRARSNSRPRRTRVAHPGLLMCLLPFTSESFRRYSLVRGTFRILSFFREFCMRLCGPALRGVLKPLSAPAEAASSPGSKLWALTRKNCTVTFFSHGDLAAWSI